MVLNSLSRKNPSIPSTTASSGQGGPRAQLVHGNRRNHRWDGLWVRSGSYIVYTRAGSGSNLESALVSVIDGYERPKKIADTQPTLVNCRLLVCSRSMLVHWKPL